MTYSYQSIITFGGCRDDFMVVTSQQKESGAGKKSAEKLVFAMAKPKVSVLSALEREVQVDDSFYMSLLKQPFSSPAVSLCKDLTHLYCALIK